MKFDKQEIDEFAKKIRKGILTAIASKGSGHVGGSLSIADTFAVLYGSVLNVDPAEPGKSDRDYVVLSKGHSGPAMYATLALKGYFPQETLCTLNQNGTILPSHTDRLKTPGVDITTGSLGQGSSLAAGVAFSDKLDGKDNYTYLIIGDGEMNEGQIWEFFLFAAHQKLTNLITFIDANGKQLDGTTDEICSLGSIEAKLDAFGYNVISVRDGNDTQQIFDAIVEAQSDKTKPGVIVLHTKKGAGVMRYEAMDNCHSIPVSKEDLASVFDELDYK